MKIAVTGHTSGIGQGLYEYFKSQGHEVLGFSKNNGYVLPESTDRVLTEILDCDIFVNNSLPVQSQIDLLEKLWEHWKNTDKKIIVIGSLATQVPVVLHEMKDYQQGKKELDLVCNRLRYSDFSQKILCSLIAIHPGFVDTNIFLEVGAPVRPPTDQLLSVSQVVDVVDYVLNSPVEIDNIVFRKAKHL